MTPEQHDPVRALAAMFKHLKTCEVPGCEACLLAAELRAEQRLSASYRKGAEESGRRWNMLDAHEQIKAGKAVDWEERYLKLVARGERASVELEELRSGLKKLLKENRDDNGQ